MADSGEAPSDSIVDLAWRHGEALWEAERENAQRYASRVRLLLAIITTMLGLVFAGAGAMARVAVTEAFSARLSQSPAAQVFGALHLLVVIAAVLALAFALIRLLFTPRRFGGIADAEQRARTSLEKDRADVTTTEETEHEEHRQEARTKQSAEGVLAVSTRAIRPTPRSSSALLALSEGVLEEINTKLDPVQWEMIARMHVAATDLRERNDGERERLARADKWLMRGIAFVVGGAILLVFMVAVIASIPLGSSHDSDALQHDKAAYSGAARGEAVPVDAHRGAESAAGEWTASAQR